MPQVRLDQLSLESSCHWPPECFAERQASETAWLAVNARKIKTNMIHNLVGCKIEKVTISLGTSNGDPNDLLTFQTDSGPVSFLAEGDCCSRSYFYEITGIEKILGKRIEEVVEIPDEIIEGELESGGDCVRAYGYRFSAAPSLTEVAGEKLETSNSAIVVFRNESNGYYGGSMELTQYVYKANEEMITSNWHRPPEK